MNNPTQEITYLAAHTFFKGELHLAGPATIAGRVEGVIVAQDQVEIAAEGIVQGDIQGAVVDIQGTVTGNILATRACRLGATARVNGELRAANLAIEEGACFVGQVHVGAAAMEGQVGAVMEEEIEEAPLSAPVNRLQTMAAEADAVAAVAEAAVSATPTVSVMPQNIQQALNRTPRIIRARVRRRRIDPSE